MLDQLFPLHPKLVHFPIALFITAFALDILSWVLRKEDLHKAALVVYVSATLLTPLVVWSGLFEQERLHLRHPVLAQHKLYAFVTMWVSLASLPVLWFFKKASSKVFRMIFTSLLLCLALAVSITGYFGGRMVYEYGAGVSQ
jgi:uncharacterized membrane protein